MFDINGIVRYIAGYSKVPNKNGDFLQEVTYYFSEPVPLILLQEIFNIDPKDPDGGERYLIDCYDINEKQAEVLQPFVNEKLDLNKYYFQLECHDAE